MKIKPDSFVTFLLLLFSIIITFVLHSQTFTLLTTGEINQVLSPDPWYVVRQTELAAHSFPSYTWFDPFTSFPDGAIIFWGPFLPLVGGLITNILGFKNEPALILSISWIPVLTAMLTIPLTYWYGKEIRGRWCGVAAALLIAVIPGSYLIRSMYGYADHHIFESFFMLAYSLSFLVTFNRLYESEEEPEIKMALLGGGVTGLLLGLGMINAPTMVIAAAITSLFVIFAGYQLIKLTKNLLPFSIFICFSSCIGAILTLLFFTPDMTREVPFIFDPVSLALVLIIPALFSVFYLITQIIIQNADQSIKKPLLAIFVAGLTTIILAFLHISNFFTEMMDGVIGIFNSVPTKFAIAEYHPLNFDIAFFNYHIMLLLLIPGLLLILIAAIRRHKSAQVYLIFWTVIVGILTITNTRFEIFLAVPLTITSAYFLDWLSHIKEINPDENNGSLLQEKTKDKTDWKKQPIAVISLVLLLVTCGLSLCIASMIATADYNYQPYIASEDWVEGMLWMKNATPDPGVDYYQEYHADSFKYPDSAYGVLSWWDYGHWITAIAHRMAVTNPFQANLDLAAQFFMSRSEQQADMIMEENKIRYIVTDADMLFDTMQMMIRVYSTDATPGQYMGLVSINDITTGKPISSIGYRQPFYESMVTKLHVFDGTYVKSEQKMLEQEGAPISGTDMVVIFPGSADPEISESIVRPLRDIPALSHYRLIWESNTSLSTTDEHDIRKVKIFERVPGAVVRGEGTIELHLITNRGREFTYQQRSINGTFTLPYSTSQTAWPVHAIGPYRIKETGKEIEVSEELVLAPF
jgi:dolichyl-diphosphooligosaccharide--protein glycosyltransferase